MKNHEKKLVSLRVRTVLKRMILLIEKDNEYAFIFKPYLEDMLYELACQDTFGTEGQLDPRGDMREHEWNMNCVQGVDQWII